MPRIDQSDYLIHFTKGANDEEAYRTFKSIIRDGRINCGTGFIRNRNCCVCFTEAPISCLRTDETFNKNYFNRYNPFGFLFSKSYIASLGGRHVIYSPEDELDQIPDELQWRYVKYEPNNQPHPIDFTWEREWRLHRPSLNLDPQFVKLVLPTMGWIQRFEQDHYDEQHMLYEECQCNREAKIFEYEQLFDENHAQQIIDDCPTPQQLPFMLTGMTQSMEIVFR